MKRTGFVLLGLALLLFAPLLPITAAQDGGDGTCFSEAPPNHLIPRMSIGAQGRNLPDGSELGIFSGDTVVGKIPPDGIFTVIDGPHCDSDFLWWMVDYNGIQGWISEGSNIDLSYSVEPLLPGLADHQDCTAILHVIAAGDTLFSIAEQYGITVYALVSANTIPDAKLLRVGDSLSIPCSSAFALPDNLTEINTGTAASVHQLFQRDLGNFVDGLYLYERPDESSYTALMRMDSTLDLYSMLAPDAAPVAHTGINNRRIYDVSVGPQGITATAEFDDASKNTAVRVVAGNSRPLDIVMPPDAGGALADLAVSPTLLATTSGSVLGNETNLPYGVYIWSLSSSSQAAFLPQNSPVVGVLFSPDSTLLATINSNNDVTVYNMLVPQPGVIATFNDGANSTTQLNGGASMAFSPDLSKIAVGGTDGSVRFWDIANNRLDSILPVLNPDGGAILSVAYSPDGTVLAAAGGFHPALEGGPFPNPDNTIYLYDVSRPAQAFEMLRASLTGHTAAVTGLAFLPSGSSLTSISADGTWRVWGAEGEIPQQVNNTPSVLYLDVQPGSVSFGGSITLSWSVSGGSGVGITRANHAGSVDVPVARDLRLEGSITYTVDDDDERNASEDLFYVNILDANGNDISGPGLPATFLLTIEPSTSGLGSACPHTFFVGDTGDCVTGDTVDVPGVWQLFEGGMMLWRGDTQTIFVLYNDGTAQYFTDSWTGEAIVTDILPPAGRVAPERGFGWVWVQQPGVRDRLGWAFSAEQGYTLRTQSGHIDSPDPVPAGVDYYIFPDGSVIRLVTYEGGATWSSH